MIRPHRTDAPDSEGRFGMAAIGRKPKHYLGKLASRLKADRAWPGDMGRAGA
jgi:hypothetical protein